MSSTRLGGPWAGPMIAGAIALAATLFATSASAAVTPNPWLGYGFLNIAHQGGEDEAPSNTMYAFESAVSERGADMLELDVHLTVDGHLVVIHDDTVSRTTNGPQSRPDSEVRGMTLAEIRALDAGYWFRPGSYSHGAPEEEYVMRGIRTGDVPPPAGYGADDFGVPTLKEVLDAFPDTPINIEIKVPDDDPDLSLPIAEALADLLNQPPYAQRDDLIVVSFAQPPLERFHDLAPHVDLAPSEAALTDWALSNPSPPLDPDPVAFQVPPYITLDPDNPPLDVPAFLINAKKAQEKGYAVHVWTNGADDETTESYRRLIAIGIEGIMTTSPGKLHEFLCEEGIRRPDGSPRCGAPPPPPPPPELKRRVKVAKKQSLRSVRRRGLRARAVCSRACEVRLELRLNSARAERHGIEDVEGKSVRVGDLTVEDVGQGGRRVFVELTREARRALRGVRKVRLRLITRGKAKDGTRVPAHHRKVRLRHGR